MPFSANDVKLMLLKFIQAYYSGFKQEKKSEKF